MSEYDVQLPPIDFHAEVEISESDKINQAFQEKPSQEIALYATHLTRPWNLAHILSAGYLATSKDSDFPAEARTHRGYYMGWEDALGNASIGKNTDISFNVGLPQRFYAEEKPHVSIDTPWKGGIGFIVPFSILQQKHPIEIKYGGFHTAKSLGKLQDTPFMELEFLKYAQFSADQLTEVDMVPSTVEDFEQLVHIARKSGELTGEDQAEIGVIARGDVLPRIPLNELMLLLPEKRKDVLIRYLRGAQNRLPNSNNLDIEKLLEQNSQVYWYPQKNISEAVKYLSVFNGPL